MCDLGCYWCWSWLWYTEFLRSPGGSTQSIRHRSQFDCRAVCWTCAQQQPLQQNYSHPWQSGRSRNSRNGGRVDFGAYGLHVVQRENAWVLLTRQEVFKTQRQAVPHPGRSFCGPIYWRVFVPRTVFQVALLVPAELLRRWFVSVERNRNCGIFPAADCWHFRLPNSNVGAFETSDQLRSQLRNWPAQHLDSFKLHGHTDWPGTWPGILVWCRFHWQ